MDIADPKNAINPDATDLATNPNAAISLNADGDTDTDTTK